LGSWSFCLNDSSRITGGSRRTLGGNSGRPGEIIQEERPGLPPEVLRLPPLILDESFRQNHEEPKTARVGQYVPVDPATETDSLSFSPPILVLSLEGMLRYLTGFIRTSFLSRPDNFIGISVP